MFVEAKVVVDGKKVENGFYTIANLCSCKSQSFDERSRRLKFCYVFNVGLFEFICKSFDED
jgi:hypothetical protein